ncbi:hypothetical protein DPX16_13014 [Anabarilius grahami]|uniref:Uncharacterized protein n=1 Tax=Anabarilius grahami TaxID=495550 RepID=A0A3N0XDJ5_ANAGA|nr:hypothetical protein DPX16_13014 [Anabarilius grahami]
METHNSKSKDQKDVNSFEYNVMCCHFKIPVNTRARSALEGVERALYDAVAVISSFVVYSLWKNENRAPAPSGSGPAANIAADRFNLRGGTEPPPHPRKRRKKRRKASSVPQGPEAFPEPVVGPETTPEVILWLPKRLALPAPPKRLALPPPPRPSALVPLPRPSDLLKPSWSVPPAPPWHSARTPDLLEPAWSVPPAPPWHSARNPDLLEPAWSVPSCTALAFSQDPDLLGAPVVCSSGSHLAFGQGLCTWPAVPPPGPPPVHLPPESFVLCLVRWSVW